MHTIDLSELDRRAVRHSIDLVDQVQPPDLARPTPCAGWLLADLLQHMTAQHHGFAAAAEGHGGDLSQWRLPVADPDVDPVAAYRTAADRVLRAFAAEDVMRQPFRLPEIIATADFPAEQAIGFHFIDYVVHGWDVARTLGQDYILDEDLSPAAMRIAFAVPNGPERSAPSAAFAPARPADPRLTPLERILRALGRDPAWPRWSEAGVSSV